MWDATPLLISIASVALISWAVWKVAGKWPALLSFAVLTAATPSVLKHTLAHGLRSHTWFASAALAAGLVFLGVKREDLRARTRIVVVCLGILIGGAIFASDLFFMVSGLGPIVVASLALWLVEPTRANRRLATTAVGIAVGSAVLAIGIWRWMHALGFRKTYLNTGFTFGTFDQIIENSQNFLQDFLLLVNGYFFGSPRAKRTLVELGLAALGTLAIAAPFVLLRSQILQRKQGKPFDRLLFLLASFWGVATAGVAASFILTTVAYGTGIGTLRYLVPLFFATGATFPIWALRSRWGRILAVGGATAFIVLSAHSLIPGAQGRPQPLYASESTPLIREAPKIFAFLRSQGATRGYTGYWNSHSLTYKSEMKISALPVFECRGSGSKSLCPFWVHVRTSWYIPRDGVRTFLLTDSGTTDGGLTAPPSEEFGQPVLERKFGELTLYIYDYDIASRFETF